MSGPSAAKPSLAGVVLDAAADAKPAAAATTTTTPSTDAEHAAGAADADVHYVYVCKKH